jgi:DNA primase
MEVFDRREVLARVELADLCDELLGPRPGGRSATWPCPDSRHGPQTGKSPPVSVFRTRYGEQRWRCHACGAGGTAIDLVMVTQGLGFRDAIGVLARRVGVGGDRVERRSPPLRPVVPERPRPQEPGEASPELERYVAACEALLWAPAGQRMRRWLAARGLKDQVLRANRVGADPGPAQMPRAKGLPRRGPGVVFPVMEHGRAVYLQTRYLRPGKTRFDNPAARLVGLSPRVAILSTATERSASPVLVCEGMPDGLTAAGAGFRAAAVLGAAYPDRSVAETLLRRYPTDQLVVAFDGDDAGRQGGQRLVELIAEAGAGHRVTVLAIPGRWADLNWWCQGAAARFETEFARAIADATGRDRSLPTGPAVARTNEARTAAIEPPAVPSKEQPLLPTAGLRVVREISM